MYNTSDKEKVRIEVDANHEAFTKMSFDEVNKGKFALLCKCKLVAILDTHEECRQMGNEKFSDRLYSILKYFLMWKILDI